MRSTLLRDADQMSMAHSLEVRVPFVDHALLETILPAPGAAKMKRGQSKPLLVAALPGIFPQEILQQKKRTFTLPFQQWMQKGLRGDLEAKFSAGRAWTAHGMNADAARDLWKRYQNGETNWARPWALYVLLAWLNTHIGYDGFH